MNCLFCHAPAVGLLRFEIGGRSATYLTCIGCAGRTMARCREDFVRAMTNAVPPDRPGLPDPDVIDVP